MASVQGAPSKVSKTPTPSTASKLASSGPKTQLREGHGMLKAKYKRIINDPASPHWILRADPCCKWLLEPSELTFAFYNVFNVQDFSAKFFCFSTVFSRVQGSQPPLPNSKFLKP
jgi:hypothetical protein